MRLEVPRWLLPPKARQREARKLLQQTVTLARPLLFSAVRGQALALLLDFAERYGEKLTALQAELLTALIRAVMEWDAHAD